MTEINNYENKINDEEYYGGAKDYWANVSPTVNGMLGGFANISFVDIRVSTNFLQTLFNIKPAPGKKYALDCGAGIGRVTENLLLPVFEKVDLVEQDKHFCDVARKVVNPEIDGITQELGIVYNKGLQEFEPEENKYDVIWSQWVLGHLKDHHLIEFLKKCIKALKKNGIICIKENFSSNDVVEVDDVDNSVTRPLEYFKTNILEKADLRIIREQKQVNLPKGLFPVHMIAVKPKTKSQ